MLEYFTKSLLESTTYIQSFSITKIDQQTASIEKENTVLRQAVLAGESYTTIASEAAVMGFVPAHYFYPSYDSN